MRYDPEKHDRRSIRLPCYDYSQFAAYFVTICAYRRACAFDHPTVREVILWAWESITEHFEEALLDEFVIMPNHVHGILWICGSRGEACLAPTLGTVIASFKSAAAKRINELRGSPGAPFWQRNYFERVVRNEGELNAIRQYIISNPEMWNEDCENPDRSSAVGKACRISDEIETVVERAEGEKGGDDVARSGERCKGEACLVPTLAGRSTKGRP